MRILILTWRDLANPAAGGAEVYTEQVAKRWAAQGHQITLFAAAVADRPTEEKVDGYSVVRRGNRYTVYRRARTWSETSWAVSGFRPGHRHDQHRCVRGAPLDQRRADGGLLPPDGRGVLGAQLPAARPAVLGRYVLEPQLDARLPRPARDRGGPQSTADAVIERFGVHNVTVVPEGFDPPVQVPDVRKEERPTLVWCARLVPYKRPLDAIEAFEIARRQIPDLQLWMIGGGPDLEKVQAAATDGVTVFGRVSEQEKVRLMAAAHVHIATSVREGWGLVVTEAAAVGTPTVAYDVPGLRDSTRAADGVVVPASPMALGRWIPTMMKHRRENPVAPQPFGGAHSWDDVAREVFLAAISVLPASARLRLVHDAA